MNTTDSSFSFIGISESQTPMAPQKYLVIGAGPVGAMAAMYAAERGHDVEVYELRNGTRDLQDI